MQVICAVIFGKRIGRSVQTELAMRDAVGVAADSGAKMGLVAHITIKIIVAEDYVGDLSMTVGDSQRDHSRAEIDLLTCVGLRQ